MNINACRTPRKNGAGTIYPASSKPSKTPKKFLTRPSVSVAPAAKSLLFSRAKRSREETLAARAEAEKRQLERVSRVKIGSYLHDLRELRKLPDLDAKTWRVVEWEIHLQHGILKQRVRTPQQELFVN